MQPQNHIHILRPSRSTRAVLSALFPDVETNHFARVNLDDLARAYAQRVGQYSTKPAFIQKMVDDFHTRLGLDGSIGGYLENRSFMWKGTYMDKDSRYIHLGSDISVREGTALYAPINGEILEVFHDANGDIDWGTNLSLKSKGYVFIFAHLAPSTPCKPGDPICRGDALGAIGRWPQNGDVWSHLHIQAMPLNIYQQHQKEEFKNLDGYGCVGQEELLAKQFIEPMGLLARLMNVNPKNPQR